MKIIITTIELFFLIIILVSCKAQDMTILTPVVTNDTLSTKKGIAAYNFTSKENIIKLNDLNTGWLYSWSVFLPMTGTASYYEGKEEFVPMIWAKNDTTLTKINYLKKGKETGKLKHLLGFNEPDRADQANMTVKECLDIWPKLMSTGLRLGSPAPANSPWLQEFMAGVEARGYRVDFIAVHTYQDFTNPNAPTELKNWLTDIYNKYKRPIWLTEFGAADYAQWKLSRYGTPTVYQAQIYMNQAIEVLKSLPFVERYAWFADRCTDEYIYGTIYDNNGQLTNLGAAFREKE